MQWLQLYIPRLLISERPCQWEREWQSDLRNWDCKCIRPVRHTVAIRIKATAELEYSTVCLTVSPWNPNDPATIRLLSDMGVDSVGTDYPELFAQI